jgi:kynureninase
VRIVTPRDRSMRGSQLSLRVSNDPKGLVQRLAAEGVLCDFREPDIVRAAPTPLYNTFADVQRFAGILRKHVLS